VEHAAYLASLAGIWARVVISPGPDFVATLHHATAGSRRAGLLVVTGIAVGTALWAAGALAGLGLVFARLSWLADLVRLAGAAALCWLGVRAWLSAGRPPASHGSAPGGHPLRAGLVTDLANPKAAVFWSSLFAALLPPDPPLWVEAASVAVAVGVAVAWYGLVAVVGSAGPAVRAYRRARVCLDRVTGGVLVALGVRLALSGEPAGR
jgi:threonine efflux protein